jgi:hypothetical protein
MVLQGPLGLSRRKLETEDYGADLGLWTGFGWVVICFLPLRWLELRKIGTYKLDGRSWTVEDL